MIITQIHHLLIIPHQTHLHQPYLKLKKNFTKPKHRISLNKISLATRELPQGIMRFLQNLLQDMARVDYQA